MKAPLFEFPSYQNEVNDWEVKKKGLLNRLNNSELVRTNLQTFETDRETAGKRYVNYIAEVLKPELEEFCQEAKVSCCVTDAWAVRYYKGDHQTIHNHRSWGFSGILYVEYDPKVHTPTCFLCPWQEPRTDVTTLVLPHNIKEGTLFIAPSFTHHFVQPNIVRKPRIVIAFDLMPEFPKHLSLNKNV